MSEWKKVTLDKMGAVSRGRSKHLPKSDATMKEFYVSICPCDIYK